MPEENKCDICGRSFDSKRGLSVHKSQAHDGEEEEENEEMSIDNQTTKTVNLGLNHVLIGVLLLGLSVGFSGGMAVSDLTQTSNGDKATINLNVNGESEGTTVTTETQDEANKEDTENNQDTNADSGNEDSGTEVSGSSPMEVFKNIANDIGADSSQLETCVKNSNGDASAEDRGEINEITGGIGTPTFFIGNSEIGYEQVEGAQPIGNMRPVIEEQLQEAQNPGEDSIEESESTLDGVTLEGEPTKGEENAPIRVIQYSDFACPWCGEWFGVDAIPQRNIDGQQSYDTLMSEYVDSGDVKFTFMDYPVSQLHRNAPQAHQAANCVLEQDQGLYWEFHDALYENRGQWMA